MGTRFSNLGKTIKGTGQTIRSVGQKAAQLASANKAAASEEEKATNTEKTVNNLTEEEKNLLRYARDASSAVAKAAKDSNGGMDPMMGLMMSMMGAKQAQSGIQALGDVLKQLPNNNNSSSNNNTGGGGGFGNLGNTNSNLPLKNDQSTLDPSKAKVLDTKLSAPFTQGMKDGDSKLIVFGAHGCGPCDQLKKTLGLTQDKKDQSKWTGTYQGKAVEYYAVEDLNKNNNPIHANAKSLSDSLRVSGYPSAYLLEKRNGQDLAYNFGSGSAIPNNLNALAEGKIKLENPSTKPIDPKVEAQAQAIQKQTEWAVKNADAIGKSKAENENSRVQSFIQNDKELSGAEKVAAFVYRHRYDKEVQEIVQKNPELLKTMQAYDKHDTDLESGGANNISQEYKKLKALAESEAKIESLTVGVGIPKAEGEVSNKLEALKTENKNSWDLSKSWNPKNLWAEAMMAASGGCVNGVCDSDKSAQEIILFANKTPEQLIALAKEKGFSPTFFQEGIMLGSMKEELSKQEKNTNAAEVATEWTNAVLKQK